VSTGVVVLFTWVSCLGIADERVAQLAALAVARLSAYCLNPNLGNCGAAPGFYPRREQSGCVSSVCACVLDRRVSRFVEQSHLYLSVRSVYVSNTSLT
jgi:hypothetical protein